MLNRESLRNGERLFREYLQSYDLSDGMIKAKVKHSYKVERNSLAIAEALQLSEEAIVLAGLIGLFHDIGRFEQARIYHNFRDYETIDHADFGVKELEKNDFVNAIVPSEYRDTFLAAIRNHNKLKIEDGLGVEALLQAKIIRDADKIDILRLRGTHEEDDDLNINKDELERDTISDYAFETFLKHEPIVSTLRKTKLDGTISICCFIFDLNYAYSYRKILENDSILGLLKYYDFTDMETQRRVNVIIEDSKTYLQSKLQGI